MAAIKTLEQAASKWVNRASVASGDYTQGISNPRRPWAEGSKAGKENWKAGVLAAGARDAFAKGVEKAGDAKWSAMAKAKGPSRFAEGVAISKDEWSKGFAPYRQTIESLTLPPRGTRGSVANYERSKAVGTALRAVKEKM
jgi:hypothetical protein